MSHRQNNRRTSAQQKRQQARLEIHRIRRALAMILAQTDLADTRIGKGEGHWGHVGDLVHTREKLLELLDPDGEALTLQAIDEEINA